MRSKETLVYCDAWTLLKPWQEREQSTDEGVQHAEKLRQIEKILEVPLKFQRA